MHAKLFSPVSFGNLHLKNRIVRSATWEGRATVEGLVKDSLVTMIDELARGGCGLIISSHVYVLRDGQGSPWQVGCYDKSCNPGLARQAEAAHAHGTPIVLQINHGGLSANPDLIGTTPKGPSAVEGGLALSLDEMAAIQEAFVRAAKAAKETGYDGVQLHAAHAYMLNQFLSPHCNKREDRYGGSLENRARYLREIYRAVRDAVGDDYPVLVKMNCTDFMDDGVTPEEAVAVCAMLEKDGIDAIEFSGGSRFGSRNSLPPGKVALGPEEGYYREQARLYKSRIRTPLILVGGIRSLAGAENILETGLADAVAFSRPLIREPDFPARWQRGEADITTCISCSLCHKDGRVNGNVHCVVDERKKQ